MSFKVGDRVRLSISPKAREEYTVKSIGKNSLYPVEIEDRCGVSGVCREDELRHVPDPSIPLRFAGLEVSKVASDARDGLVIVELVCGQPRGSVNSEDVTPEDLTRAIEWLTAVREEMGK